MRVGAGTPGPLGLATSAIAALMALSSTGARAQGPVAPTAAERPDPAFLQQYCQTCHNDRSKAGSLSLVGLDVTAVEGHADVWETVVRKLRTGMMPPQGAPRPPATESGVFVSTLEGALDRAAEERPDPGAPALHRLNRTEYANVIRDLLALDVDVTTLLPPDDVAAGFDNIADVLGVSPAHIEGYAVAAAKISRLAVGDPSIGLDRATYRMPGGVSQDAHVEGFPLGTRGGLIVEHTFPLDAEYELDVGQAGRGRLGGPRTAGPRADDVYVAIDGRRIALPDRGPMRLAVTAGPHTIAAAAIVRTHTDGADGVFDVAPRTPGITRIGIAGPFEATGPGDTPSRRQVFVCTPSSAAEELPCARRILATLATRAYRRSVADSSADVETLLEFFRAGRDPSFESGIQRALARVLVDPQFLFRFEREPASARPGDAFRVTDLELASRLSFFLWSSIPDDELRDLAAEGRLREPGVLDAQVRRMLADARADALVSNFAAQWLYLRELPNVQPDSPDFDGNLRQAFQRETELLFRTILREDRSIVDLLDADFTFVNERLAEHYDIPGIRGSRTRRVDLPADSPRRGLLGQGSILTVTSAANRTSPVVRGKWVLENLLGVPPPQPPPGVEVNLEPDPTAPVPTTLRQRMELHRTSPACAPCHRIMDPIGFALENFDHVGKWRAQDSGAPIDAAGRLVDGTELDGAASLRQALLARSDVFVSVATEKMLTYAVGRAIRPQDMPAVRAITRAAARDDYRFSSLVLGVVRTPQFQMRTAATREP